MVGATGATVGAAAVAGMLGRLGIVRGAAGVAGGGAAMAGDETGRFGAPDPAGTEVAVGGVRAVCAPVGGAGARGAARAGEEAGRLGGVGGVADVGALAAREPVGIRPAPTVVFRGAVMAGLKGFAGGRAGASPCAGLEARGVVGGAFTAGMAATVRAPPGVGTVTAGMAAMVGRLPVGVPVEGLAGVAVAGGLPGADGAPGGGGGPGGRPEPLCGG
jgi:hypothetical protein